MLLLHASKHARTSCADDCIPYSLDYISLLEFIKFRSFLIRLPIYRSGHDLSKLLKRGNQSGTFLVTALVDRKIFEIIDIHSIEAVFF